MRQAGSVSPAGWMPRLSSAGTVLLGVALLAGPARGQSVPVQQVEAFENPPTNNHSSVADCGTATFDENAIRRIDYVVNNEALVFVAGAVTGGAFANQNLVWSARNSLAIRGDSSGTPFDPSPAANTITAGKRRA